MVLHLAKAWASVLEVPNGYPTNSLSTPNLAKAPKLSSHVGSKAMIALTVNDQSQVSETRRRATEMAERQGFGDTDSGRVALVATELATNILKHGNGGEILAGPYGGGTDSGIELIALDKGKGMSNVAVSMAD